ncbi:hypothetical protein ACOME3_006018 [Neoechinorhynchus agilis]
MVEDRSLLLKNVRRCLANVLYRVSRKVDKHHRVSVVNDPEEESVAIKRIRQDPYYYLGDGLRRVHPYKFTWKTFAKRRWIGRTLIDVYSNEFAYLASDDTKTEQVREMIETGKIRVNGQVKSCEYVVHTIEPIDSYRGQKKMDNDQLTNDDHRHEKPVLDAEITICKENDQYLVICKPSSIPVHPCGNYRFNTVTNILEHEQGRTNLKLVHRLAQK